MATAIDTHNSPRIYRKEDGVFIDVTYERDGEAYIVTAPLGDGKYHLSRALEVVMDYSARRSVEEARLGE
jgi:hypothetical protein